MRLSNSCICTFSSFYASHRSWRTSKGSGLYKYAFCSLEIYFLVRLQILTLMLLITDSFWGGGVPLLRELYFQENQFYILQQQECQFLLFWLVLCDSGLISCPGASWVYELERLGQGKEGEVLCVPGFLHGSHIECCLLVEMIANLEYSKFESVVFFFLLCKLFNSFFIFSFFHNGKVQFTGPVSFCIRSSFWIPRW